MRARVPLVLFRAWSATSFSSLQVVLQSYVIRYPLQLQLQLCWPPSVRVHGPHIKLEQQFNLTRNQSSISSYLLPPRNEGSRSTLIVNSDRELVRDVVQRGQALPGMAGIVRASRSVPSALPDVTRSKETAAPRRSRSVSPATTNEAKPEPAIVAAVIAKTNAVDSAPTVLAHRSESLPSALVSGTESVPTAPSRTELLRPIVTTGSEATRHTVEVGSGSIRSALVERSRPATPAVVVRSESASQTIVDRSWLMPALLSGSIRPVVASVSTIGNWNVARALHKKSRSRASLCNLGVLRVSVVDEFRAKIHHRDTENTEVAQRNLITTTLHTKPVASLTSTQQTSEGVVSRSHASGGGGFSRHNLLPAPREFLSAPTPRENKELSSTQPAPIVTQRAAVPLPTPPMDIGRLSEEVYRHIQRKIRIERERRGL